MEDRYVLKEANYVKSDILKLNSFARYDLSEEWRMFDIYLDNFKNRIGRFPFIYEVLERSLAQLNSTLQEQTKEILFKKNYKWFINTGQYFFYNLYQWVQGLKSSNSYNKDQPINKKHNSEYKIEGFMENWWKKFCEFENQANDEETIQFPEKILLELTNNCNLNCIMCGVGKYGYNPSKNLSLDLLRDLCKNVLSKVKLIRLNGLGESSIIPNFLGYLELIGNLPAKLEIVTNLTVRKSIIWEKLIEKQTNFLISCDSSNPLKFEQIRKGSIFSNFEDNLKYVGNNVSNPLQAQIIFTLMEQNMEDLLGVIDMAVNYGLGGIIVNVVKLDHKSYSWIDNNFDKIQNLFRKSYEYAKERGINLKLPDHLGNNLIDPDISTISSNFYCENPWEEVYIRYNGDLTVCNMLNPYIYGNCINYSFEKIWNGLNAKMFRNFINTKYRQYYCQECYYLV